MKVIRYRKKVLLINADNNSYIETALFKQKDSSIFHDIGLDAYLRYMNTGKIDEKFIQDISFSFFKELFHFLPCSNKSIAEYKTNLLNSEFENFKLLEEYYDYIFVDLPNGNNKVAEYFLKNSDSNIINITQSKHIFDKINNNYIDLFDLNNNSRFIIGAYDKDSIYNIKNIIKLMPSLNKKLAVIPYNIEFMDSISNSKIMRFLQNINLSEDDSSIDFINRINEACNMISLIPRRE
ncbi:MAG TPA: hypothetical protein GXZ90_08700 [Clostridiales bacterium]|nr:hypothetical protein [Clostridiales bacterium]